MAPELEAESAPSQNPEPAKGPIRRALNALAGLVRPGPSEEGPADTAPPPPEPQPRPARERSDPPRPWVNGLGDPSLTLLEDGPAVSVMLADGCHEDAIPGRLVLDGVTWARGDESVSTLQTFPSVLLYRTDSQGWVAEDPRNGRVFPGSGQPRFPTLFLPWREFCSLRDMSAASGDANLLLSLACLRFGLPHERLPRRVRRAVAQPPRPA